GRDKAAPQLRTAQRRDQQDDRQREERRPGGQGPVILQVFQEQQFLHSQAAATVCRCLGGMALLRTSLSTWPSLRRMTRRAQAAMSFSCVTMMIVLPSSLRASSMVMISSEVFES